MLGRHTRCRWYVEVELRVTGVLLLQVLNQSVYI